MAGRLGFGSSALGAPIAARFHKRNVCYVCKRKLPSNPRYSKIRFEKISREPEVGCVWLPEEDQMNALSPASAKRVAIILRGMRFDHRFLEIAFRVECDRSEHVYMKGALSNLSSFRRLIFS